MAKDAPKNTEAPNGETPAKKPRKPRKATPVQIERKKLGADGKPDAAAVWEELVPAHLKSAAKAEKVAEHFKIDSVEAAEDALKKSIIDDDLPTGYQYRIIRVLRETIPSLKISAVL